FGRAFDFAGGDDAGAGDRGGAVFDFGGAGQVGAGDRHRGAAGGRAFVGADGGHGRGRDRGFEGEFVAGPGCRFAAGGEDPDVDFARRVGRGRRFDFGRAFDFAGGDDAGAGDRGGAVFDFGGAGQVGAGDRHRGAAGGRAFVGADGGHGRGRDRGFEGEFVAGPGCRFAAGGEDPDVDFARRVGRGRRFDFGRAFDFAGGDDAGAGDRGGAVFDFGGAGQVGAGDRHRGAAGGRAFVGADGGDGRGRDRGFEGEFVAGPGCRFAAGGEDPDVDFARRVGRGRRFDFGRAFDFAGGDDAGAGDRGGAVFDFGGAG